MGQKTELNTETLRSSRGNQVSMLDTKTGGPMGVLDGET